MPRLHLITYHEITLIWIHDMIIKAGFSFPSYESIPDNYIIFINNFIY